MDIDKELERRWVNRVKVFVDRDNCRATFLLYGLKSERLLGYQTYNPKSLDKKSNDPLNGRYFTYQPRTKHSGDYAVFGSEYVEGRDIVFITEGIFEAVRLIEMGYDAIAVLCSSPPEGMVREIHRRWKKVVWCGDNDKAGNSSSLVDNSERMCFNKDLDEVDEQTLVSEISKFFN